MEAVEDDFYVCGGDPVLQDRRGVEVEGAGATLKGREGDSGRQTEAHVLASRVSVGIGATGFLLVSFGNGSSIGPSVHTSALARVKLKRLPGFAVVHALVDGYGVGFGGEGTERQTYVSKFVLLAERQKKSDIVRGGVN